MIAYFLEHNIYVETDNTHQTTGSETKKSAAANTVSLDNNELKFGGMESMKIPHRSAGETYWDAIRLKMDMEMDLYLQRPGIQLRGQNRDFTNLLVW